MFITDLHIGDSLLTTGCLGCQIVQFGKLLSRLSNRGSDFFVAAGLQRKAVTMATGVLDIEEDCGKFAVIFVRRALAKFGFVSTREVHWIVLISRIDQSVF